MLKNYGNSKENSIKTFLKNNNQKRKNFKKLRLKLSDLYIDRVYLKPTYFNFFFVYYYKQLIQTKKYLLKLKKKSFLPHNFNNYLQEKSDVLHFSNRIKIFYKQNKRLVYYLSLENHWFKLFSNLMSKTLYKYFKDLKLRKFNFFKKKFLNYYCFYRNNLFKSLRLKKKRFKTKLFFFYIKSKQNKVLQKYYNMRYFFSNFSQKNYYRKMLYFYQFYSRVFFFKNKKSLVKSSIFRTFFRSKKSYYDFYVKLNSRLVSWLFNLGVNSPKNLILKNRIYINGRLSSFKNILLKKNDFIFFDLSLKGKKYQDFLSYILKKSNISSHLYYNFKIKKNLLYLLKSKNFFFEHNFLFFHNNLNIFKTFKFPKKFYLKIFKRLKYLKNKNYPMFKEMKLRRNKYFKFKYLIKNRMLKKRKIQNIFRKYKTVYRYKDQQDSMNSFFRKARIFERQKRNNLLINYNSSVYRRLKN